MKMKKYTADTMVNAMKKVRADFGDQAIILSTNVIKSKGFLGLFKKKTVEVVASYDEPVTNLEKPTPPVIEPKETVSSAQAAELKNELKEMKKMIHTLQPTTDMTHYPDELQPLLIHLKKQSLRETLIKQIGDEIFEMMKAKIQNLSLKEQKNIARACLKDIMKQNHFGGVSFERKYVNVLGPTGVGKTTTIAKIAARALLEGKKKVGFITTDTYRIAAIEQLRTYANLLQAPVEVVYNHEDFNQAIKKLSHLDVVFIDTAGRNYKEDKFVDDLTALFDFSLDMESYLVLSMTSKEEDMQVIIEQFENLPIEKFIFTKVDETNSIGSMFNLMEKYSYGMAYYTDGQNVPEDLVEAELDDLVDLLLDGVEDA